MISLEPPIKRLLAAMLLGGISGAVRKRCFKIIPSLYTQSLSAAGNKIKLPIEWTLIETWNCCLEDFRWVNANNKHLNGFLSLCKIFELNARRIRAYINTPPEGFHEQPIIIAKGSEQEMRQILKTQNAQFFNRKTDMERMLRGIE